MQAKWYALISLCALGATSAHAADVSYFGGLGSALSDAAKKGGLKGQKAEKDAERVLLEGRAEANRVAKEVFGQLTRAHRLELRARARKRLADGVAKAQAARHARRAEHEKLALAHQQAVDAAREQDDADAREAETLGQKMRALVATAKTKESHAAAVAEAKKLLDAFNAGAAARKARRDAKLAAVKQLVEKMKAGSKPQTPTKTAAAPDEDGKARLAAVAEAIRKATEETRQRTLKKLRAAIPPGKGVFKALQDHAAKNPINVPNWLKR